MSQIVFPSASTTSAGTFTMTAADLNGSVGFGASCTYTLLAGVPVGTSVKVYSTAASSITVSFTASGGDSITPASITLLQNVGAVLIKETPTLWRAVQFGGLTANGFRWAFSGGINSAWPVNVSPTGTVTDLGSAIAATTADPSGFGVTGSGTDVAFPAGAVGISSALGANGARWGWTLASLGLTAPATPFIGNTQFTFSGTTGVRGGAALHLLAGFATSATAPVRANGVYIATSGTGVSYSFLVSAGGGLPANATGAATMTGSRDSQWYNTPVNPDYYMARLDSGIIAGYNTSGAAPATTTTPTHFTLWGYVGTGTLTNTITFLSPTGLVWW